MTTPRNPSDREAGFTLLEVLAVLVILGMAAGVLATQFAAPTERAKRDATMAAIFDLDARARLLAKTGGGAAIRLDPGRLVLTSAAQIVSEVPLNPELELRLRTRGNKAKISFDGSGRSESFGVEWKEGPTVRAVSICGDTGWREDRRP